MNAPEISADASRAAQPRPWWERLLLEAELGGELDTASEDARPLVSAAVRDRVVDLAFFAYAALAALATAVNDRAEVGTAKLAVNGALAGIACMSLLARRRRPLGVAWLTVTLSALSSASVHAAQVAIFSAAIHARPRRAVQATAGAIAATAVDCAIYTGHHGHDAFSWNFFAIWSAITVAAFALGSFIRVRRELVISLHDRAVRAQAEQELRVREARLAERTRIAREMHDVLAHRISLLAVHAGALEFNADPTSQELSEGLGVIRASARSAQQDLREVIGVLRTDPEDEAVDPPQPTLADLDMLVAESRAVGTDVTVIDELPDRELPALAGRTAYRVVQEALTNIRKHAPAQTVRIQLAGRAGATVEVEVVNRPAAGQPARSSDPTPEHVGSGTGLIGLAERLSLAGGVLAHERLAGNGFRLTASIPWTIADEANADQTEVLP